MTRYNESTVFVGVRIPAGVLEEVEKYAASQGFSLSRSAVIVYLLSRGLVEQGVKVKEQDGQ